MFLTLSNPIFLPTAYSPALISFGRVRGWWITCNYPAVLKDKNIEKQKENNLRYLLAKVRTTWGKASDRLRQRVNATKTVSDIFRHPSGTGKSYCRTRSDVGSERVKMWQQGKSSKMQWRRLFHLHEEFVCTLLPNSFPLHRVMPKAELLGRWNLTEEVCLESQNNACGICGRQCCPWIGFPAKIPVFLGNYTNHAS